MTRRSKTIVVVGAWAVAALVATSVRATHNVPDKSKKLKVDLAVAYNPCTAPNDMQGATLLPACHPPVATTATNPTHKVTYGLKGVANLQASAATGDIKLKIKSKDIQDNGALIADGQTLGLHIDHAVSTSHSCASGDPLGCTTIDLGAIFNDAFKASCLEGKCTLNSSINTLFGTALLMEGDAINLTLSGVGLNDQDGDLAFAEGVFIE